jgi:hypothetical protein
MTKLVFGSDYSKLKTDDIISLFENDPRLVFATKEELFQVPIIKLAARYGLVSSNCESEPDRKSDNVLTVPSRRTRPCFIKGTIFESRNYPRPSAQDYRRRFIGQPNRCLARWQG